MVLSDLFEHLDKGNHNVMYLTRAAIYSKGCMQYITREQMYSLALDLFPPLLCY